MNEFEGYENPTQAVLENLKTWGKTTISDDDDENLIVETLLKLPERIREKVIDKVVFILMHDTYGTVTIGHLQKKIRKKESEEVGDFYSVHIKQALILLNFSLMKKKSKFFKMSTIAHEIAHFVLGNLNMPGKSNDERCADDLTEKWGFKRAYKSYKMFERGMIR